jgi:hypothetical protein
MLSYGLPGAILLLVIILVFVLVSWAFAVAICHAIFHDDSGPHRPIRLSVQIREMQIDPQNRRDA